MKINFKPDRRKHALLLSRYMNVNNLKQKEISKWFGCSQGTISKILGKKTSLTVEQYAIIASEMYLDVDCIFYSLKHLKYKE